MSTAPVVAWMPPLGFYCFVPGGPQPRTERNRDQSLRAPHDSPKIGGRRSHGSAALDCAAAASLSENRWGLSRFCVALGAKWDCPLLPGGFRIGSTSPAIRYNGFDCNVFGIRIQRVPIPCNLPQTAQTIGTAHAASLPELSSWRWPLSASDRTSERDRPN
jgi:hypothetical protein